ncbi:MAG: PKD domain-containing protein, partial [Syntrophobacter sp.]
MKVLKRICLTAAVVVFGLTWFLPATCAEEGLSLRITSYNLIGQFKLGPICMYTYKAAVTNSGASPVLSARAVLTGHSRYSVVVDGRLSFGDVPAGATVMSRTTFTIVQPCRYPIDSTAWSWTFTGTPAANTQPIANAGPDQTVHTGSLVRLDGGKSSDADGDPLTFRWSLVSIPENSAAGLSGPELVAPSFVVDRPGTYVAQLIVNDGKLDSEPSKVTVSTDNSRPVADAGTNQTAFVGDRVTLDGSKSSDVDGDALTFRWSFASKPSGSTASVSGTDEVKPTFVMDAPGAYVAQLIVNDGKLDSTPATVSITSQNSRPTANAGPGQTALVGSTVTLDGSKSTDVDGDLLTFKWSLTSKPAESDAAVSDFTEVRPTLVIDKAGAYIAQLIVNDGTVDSTPATVSIITENSKPVANTGSDQTVFVGDTVTLDGSKSTDVDGDQLAFRWSFISKPPGSGATLPNPEDVRPAFVVDMPGTYIAQLIVNDGRVDSTPATVTIITVNSKPVANAGPDQTVYVGSTVTLNGGGSRDADNDPLSYRWSMTSRPAESLAELINATDARPSFSVDKPGTYIAQLIVNDGTVDSAPATVTISTINSKPVANAGADLAVFVRDMVVLDGTGSRDADGDPLSYTWSFTSIPPGSSASLVNPGSAKPSFAPDVAGTYVVQLIVNDSKISGDPDTVTVTASLRTVLVPDVAGFTRAAAESAIAGANLLVGSISSAYSSTVTAGNIISQTPVAGSIVSEGTAVNLVVSLGPPMTTVPNVTGMPRAEATAAIVAANLAVGTVTTANSASVPSGSVISQDPAAGTSVPEGLAVSLVISIGPVLPSAPDLGLITVGQVANGQTMVSGRAGSVQGGLAVRATNSSTNETVSVSAGADGSFVLSLSAQPKDVLSLVAVDGSGLSSAPVTVSVPETVPPAADKIPEGSFGDVYRDLIPDDAVITQYDEKRFSLVTGTVTDIAGVPLPGVTIAIFQHADYGTARTGEDGRFTLPVEGGLTLTVTYARTGFISSHRQVYVPWNDFAAADTVQLITED